MYHMHLRYFKRHVLTNICIYIYTLYIYIPYIYIHIMDFTLQTHYIWWFTVMLDHDKGTFSESMNYECWRPFNSSLRKLSAQDIQCSVCHSVHLDNCGVDVTDQSLCLNHRSLLTWVFIHVISWQWVSDWLVAVSLSKATSENCFLLENGIDMCSTSYSQYIYIYIYKQRIALWTSTAEQTPSYWNAILFITDHSSNLDSHIIHTAS